MDYKHIDDDPKNCCCPECSAKRRKRAGYLALEDCKRGSIYRLYSRNLSYGVFDGDRGFCGIRTKFGERYLFTEYHYDHPPFATAMPMEAVGFVSEGVPLNETLGTIDSNTGRGLAFDRPVAEGGRGWYYTDTGDAALQARPQAVRNQLLFDLLLQVEKDNGSI